jgi:hypothetical protein
LVFGGNISGFLKVSLNGVITYGVPGNPSTLYARPFTLLQILAVSPYGDLGICARTEVIYKNNKLNI